jgi:hypothetical protein
MRTTGRLLLTALLLAGCSLEITSFSTDTLSGGLEVELTLHSAEVDRDTPFTVRFTATNTTTVPLQIVTGHGCLVTPGVYRNGVRVPFVGSAWGCTAAITTHVFEPGETKVFEWEMRARLYAQHEGDIEGAPAPSGRYTVRVEFDTMPVGSQRRPGVEEPLRVR